MSAFDSRRPFQSGPYRYYFMNPNIAEPTSTAHSGLQRLVVDSTSSSERLEDKMKTRVGLKFGLAILLASGAIAGPITIFSNSHTASAANPAPAGSTGLGP